MDVLGHSPIAVIMSIYGHVITDMQRLAAEEVDGALMGEEDGEPAIRDPTTRLLSRLLSAGGGRHQ